MDDAQFAKFMDLIQVQFQGIQEQFQGIQLQFQGIQNQFQGIQDQFQGIQDQFQEVFRRLDASEAEMKALRLEMRERFESVNDRLDAVVYRTSQISTGFDDVRIQVLGAREDVLKLDNRVHGVGTNVYDLTTRINGLSDEMRQRFRGINERLAG